MDNNFEKLLSNVPELHTKSHAHIIYGLMRWFKPNKILEIGCYCGYLSCVVAKAMLDNGITRESDFTIFDNFSLHGVNPAIVTNNLTLVGVSEAPVYILPLDTQTLPPDQWPRVEFAIIDGDHSESGAVSDFINCANAGASVVVMHDTVGWWGPRNLVDQWRKLSNNNDNEGFDAFDMVEAIHDSGLAIFVRKSAKPDAGYTQGRNVDESVSPANAPAKDKVKKVKEEAT